MSERRSEKCHHPVAGELIHNSLEAVNLSEGELQVTIEEIPILLGVEALGDGRRPHEVTKEDGDELALAGNRGRAGPNSIGEAFRDVSHEACQTLVEGGSRPRGFGRGGRRRRRRLRLDRSAAIGAKTIRGIERRAATRAA